MIAFARPLGWFCLAAIVVLSLLPASIPPRTGAGGSFEHIVAYFVATALLTVGGSRSHAWRVLAGVGLLAACLELAQTLAPGRHSEFAGFAASFTGIVLGIAAVAFVARRQMNA